MKDLIGKGSGEQFQMAFGGQGWVLVQPSEGQIKARVVRQQQQRRRRAARQRSWEASATSFPEVSRYHRGRFMASSDDTCPVCRTADVICGKWTLLVIRDLSEGRSRFCELERSLRGISPRTLSLRLRALEEEGIVERTTFAEVPPRVEYALTEKGLALVPIIDSMREYGRDWLAAECAAHEPAVAAVAHKSEWSAAPETRSFPSPGQPQDAGHAAGHVHRPHAATR